MDEKLKGVFQAALDLPKEEVDALDENSSINTVKRWDSLGHLKLITALEKEYKISIETMEAMELINVQAVKELLEKKGQ